MPHFVITEGSRVVFHYRSRLGFALQRRQMGTKYLNPPAFSVVGQSTHQRKHRSSALLAYMGGIQGRIQDLKLGVAQKQNWLENFENRGGGGGGGYIFQMRLS